MVQVRRLPRLDRELHEIGEHAAADDVLAQRGATPDVILEVGELHGLHLPSAHALPVPLQIGHCIRIELPSPMTPVPAQLVHLPAGAGGFGGEGAISCESFTAILAVSHARSAVIAASSVGCEPQPLANRRNVPVTRAAVFTKRLRSSSQLSSA